MNHLFNIKDKVVLVTGGYGALGSSISHYLSQQGAEVVIIGRSQEKATALINKIKEEGNKGYFVQADVMKIDELRKAKAEILERSKRIDVLINVAGGNVPGATLRDDQPIFDMKIEDWDKVINLNLNGTIYPCLVFGEAMAQAKSGSIINISSMAALAVLTRVPGYSAAKAAITNFTKWMANDLAQKYGDKLRVNAIAPGFFIGEQNRKVLINPDGTLTERSHKILNNTPMGRFGDLSELNGYVHYLSSEASSFVTATVLPIDGGFIAFSGV